MDLAERRALEPDRRGLLSELTAWIEAVFGHVPRDPSLFVNAVTHASRENETSYERLEFLGDRVLGLSIAEWLMELFPDEPEGILSRRINNLVSGVTCAEVAREIGAADHVRLGKGAQATIRDGDNVMGDVMEALLGALYLEAGLDVARHWVRRHWAGRTQGSESARKHPKAELQDWALARNLGLPVYTSVGESGPDHLPCHTVSVRVATTERQANAPTKREAETAAARLLIEALRAPVAASPRGSRRKPRTLVPAPRVQ